MGIELEEYKILQDKIDKIGDFRFKIKGWTITLFTGFILGTLASPLPKIAFLFAFVIVALFHYFERYQSIWHKTYSRRIIEIENQLRKSTKGFPKIALHTLKVHHQKKRKFIGRFMLRANNIFYVILYVVILILFVLNPVDKKSSEIKNIYIETPVKNELIK